MGVRGTALSSMEGAPHPGQGGVGRAGVSRRKSLITTGRYNPQGCGMLDSGRSRCQASLKLGRAYRCVWCGAVKFAYRSMVLGSESKRALVRREASETEAPIMLGRVDLDPAAASILSRGTAQPERLGRQTEQRRANFPRTVRGLRTSGPFRVDGIPRARLAYAPVSGRLSEA
jgi:hypothetical protein